MSTKKKRNVKVGLALGSGTAKGFSHIGVLKCLEKYNIKPDMIAGTSAGAVMGALYASGMAPDTIKTTFAKIDWKEMFDFVIPEKGLVNGAKFERYIELLTQNKDFKDLNIPLYVVATNITERKKAIFDEGNVAKAVRASMAIPGIFTPVKIGDDEYLDGGLVDPVPIEILKEKGADVIIAVELSSKIKEMVVPGKGVKSRKDFLKIMEEKFVISELALLREFLKARDIAKQFIPKILRNWVYKLKVYIVDKFIRPSFVFRYFSKSQVPKILSMTYAGIDIMSSELTRTKLDSGDVDVVISPKFKKAGWTDFDMAPYFISRGSYATKRKINDIKKAIRQARSHL